MDNNITDTNYKICPAKEGSPISARKVRSGPKSFPNFCNPNPSSKIINEECDADQGENLGLQRRLSGKVGTPLYSSPEQEDSMSYNDKTDVYSIGIILYEMLGQFTTYHMKFKHLNGLRQTGKVEPVFRKKFPEESAIIED